MVVKIVDKFSVLANISDAKKFTIGKLWKVFQEFEEKQKLFHFDACVKTQASKIQPLANVM